MSAYVVPKAPVRIALRAMLRTIRRERADPRLHCIADLTVTEFRRRWPDRAPTGC